MRGGIARASGRMPRWGFKSVGIFIRLLTAFISALVMTPQLGVVRPGSCFLINSKKLLMWNLAESKIQQVHTIR